jgi:hypothetical protein
VSEAVRDLSDHALELSDLVGDGGQMVDDRINGLRHGGEDEFAVLHGDGV